MKYTALALFLVLMLSSCVTKKKFNNLLFEKNQLQRNYDDLVFVHEQNKKLLIQKDSLELLQEDCSKKLKSTQDELSSTRVSFQDINVRYNKLVDQNKFITDASAKERQSFLNELNDKDDILEKKRKELDSLQLALVVREKALEASTSALGAQNEKLQQLQSILEQKNGVLQSIQDKLRQTLSGINSADISIVQKDGKLYTTISQDLLFASGSSKIDPKGENAIKSLAQVLAKYQDIEILVEGHTDTDGSEDLNWKLSADRAVVVTKVLMSQGVEATRIVPSGRAYFLPIGDNKNWEGKKKNRRTEIIISPRLQSLYDYIK